MVGSPLLQFRFPQKDLAIEEDQLQELTSAYSLSSGCLLLFFGRLADLYGRKRAFMAGTLCQVDFSLGCGFAQDGLTLAVLRGFQGIGGAATIPSSLGILANAFPPSRARSIAFATFAAGAPVGGAFGVIIGGVLTQLTSTHWRSQFYLAAAFSAFTGVSGLISFDADVPSSEVVKRVDWIGMSLVTIGLVLVVFVLGQGEIASDDIITLLGVIMLALFVSDVYVDTAATHEGFALDSGKGPDGRYPCHCILKLEYFHQLELLGSAVLSRLSVLDGGQNYGPIHSHVQTFIVGCLCGDGRFQIALDYLFSGTLLTAAAAMLFALINPSVTYWAFGFPSTVLVVFGSDFVYSAVDRESAKLGVTVNSNGSNVPMSAQLIGYKDAQWTSAAFAFMAALMAALFLRSVGIVGHNKIIKHVDSDQTMAIQPVSNDTELAVLPI
ncbi:major facilitator superfamily-domain-containing protein [Suillus spraguei]|nr:major facilitator superfamily-domain-containing protein [Suillus spraguei]